MRKLVDDFIGWLYTSKNNIFVLPLLFWLLVLLNHSVVIDYFFSRFPPALTTELASSGLNGLVVNMITVSLLFLFIVNMFALFLYNRLNLFDGWFKEHGRTFVLINRLLTSVLILALSPFLGLLIVILFGLLISLLRQIVG